VKDNNTQQQPYYGPLSGTTRVSWYQKKHSLTHQPDHHPIFISFFHLPQSIVSSLSKLCVWQSFCTTSFHVLFGLPLGLEHSTSFHIFLHLTRMWANAQCDGCPAEHRWRPLFNAAKFARGSLLDYRAVMLPRRETR